MHLFGLYYGSFDRDHCQKRNFRICNDVMGVIWHEDVGEKKNERKREEGRYAMWIRRK